MRRALSRRSRVGAISREGVWTADVCEGRTGGRYGEEVRFAIRTLVPTRIYTFVQNWLAVQLGRETWPAIPLLQVHVDEQPRPEHAEPLPANAAFFSMPRD